MPKTPDYILRELFDYLGDTRWELAELLFDVTEGANILNPTTKKLVKELIDTVPNNDDLNVYDIIAHLYRVGTPYAVTTADDLKTMI